MQLNIDDDQRLRTDCNDFSTSWFFILSEQFYFRLFYIFSSSEDIVVQGSWLFVLFGLCVIEFNLSNATNVMAVEACDLN